AGGGAPAGRPGLGEVVRRPRTHLRRRLTRTGRRGAATVGADSGGDRVLLVYPAFPAACSGPSPCPSGRSRRRSPVSRTPVRGRSIGARRTRPVILPVRTAPFLSDSGTASPQADPRPVHGRTLVTTVHRAGGADRRDREDPSSCSSTPTPPA